MWYGYGLSDKGFVRPNNEDEFYINNSLGLYIVADGMGGVPGGEVASRLIVDHLPALIEKSVQANNDITSTEFKNAVRRNISTINDMVVKEGTLQGFDGMGSTLVLAILKNKKAFVCHVGDSRCYHFHADHLNQITKDHALDIESLRHILTRVVGMVEPIQTDVVTIDVNGDDRLLLCTDGLTNMLEDTDISEIIRGFPPKEASEKLIEAANNAGGRDNSTAVVIGRN